MSRLIEGVKDIVEIAKLTTELAQSTTPGIDERFMRIAEAAANQPNSFFQCIGASALVSDSRPESIRHELTLLQPNAYNTAEVDGALGLVELMLGAEQTPELTAAVSQYAAYHEIFERMQPSFAKPGEKFIVVSNHLKLPDQGFTMGLLYKAASEQGINRLEHNLTVVVGRLIGYYQLKGTDLNIVDGILRKAGSVLKTFPSGGSEAMTEDLKLLSAIRFIYNLRTKQAFTELMQSREGRIVCMAPSGTEDKESKDRMSVKMSKFGKGTCELLIQASETGATVIPIFVDYKPGSSIVSLLEPMSPGSVKNRGDCDNIGQAIATEGNKLRNNNAAKYPDEPRFNQTVVYATE